MSHKKLVSCIYLKNGNAVTGLKDDTVVELNPVELAVFYDKNHSDELLIFDLSGTDEEHEEALLTIREICNKIKIPVIGAGHVSRMEDIKKLLYAGCKRAALNYAKEGNIAITEEVSLKFGKEKITVCIDSPEQLEDHKELLEKYVEELILINKKEIKNVLHTKNSVPILVVLPEVSLDKLMELLSQDMIVGITGNAVNTNAKELHTIKELCKGNGIGMKTLEPVIKWEEFKLNSDGHVTVVVQDHKTLQVLMVAYMNEEAYLKTLQTKRMTYFSRSRNEIWVKGDTSGHYQHMISMSADCDMDTILAKVSQVGVACHTGSYSCFFNDIIKDEAYEDTNPLTVFESVFDVIKDRKTHPKEGSYTNYLFDKGVDKILKKLGEEATEIVIAAKNPNAEEIKYEISDFLYHMMVLMVEKGVSWEEITQELSNR